MLKTRRDYLQNNRASEPCRVVHLEVSAKSYRFYGFCFTMITVVGKGRVQALANGLIDSFSYLRYIRKKLFVSIIYCIFAFEFITFDL